MPLQLSNIQRPVFLGKPELTSQPGLYAIKKKAILGRASLYACPKCGKPITVVPEQPGISRKACPKCATEVLVRCGEKSQPGSQQEQTLQMPPKERGEKQGQLNGEKFERTTCVNGSQMPKLQQNNQPAPPTDRIRFGTKNKVNARIVWGGFLSRKTYTFKEGMNWIGRWDSNEPSEIMVNDEFMSRRSACIEVSRQKSEFLFKFTVYKNTNPVKINGRPLEAGQSIYLNYDDSIVMGVTTFFIRKMK